MPDPLGCSAISFSIARHLPPAAWILDNAWLLKLNAATVTLCSRSPVASTFSCHDHCIVGLGMPIDLAEVYGSVVATGLLEPPSDIAPEGCASFTRGRLESTDKADYPWICLFKCHFNPPHGPFRTDSRARGARSNLPVHAPRASLSLCGI